MGDATPNDWTLEDFRHAWWVLKFMSDAAGVTDQPAWDRMVARWGKFWGMVQTAGFTSADVCGYGVNKSRPDFVQILLTVGDR